MERSAMRMSVRENFQMLGRSWCSRPARRPYALRGHLTEYGWIVAQGPSHVAKLIALVDDLASGLPQAAREVFAILAETVKSLDGKIRQLDAEITRRAKEDETARRLMTIPGIGATTS
jgi:transposase